MSLNLYQEVYVSPAENQDRREVGVVAIVSANQLALAVSFPDKPWWSDALTGLMLFGTGIIMLFNRPAVNSLWVDVQSGKKFLVTNVPQWEEVKRQ